MFAYCGNNPVSRKDEGGNWWLLSIGIGIATQYASDVIGNLLAGKTGADIFIPTSSVGEYIAAGVTALIPGSGFGGALVRNVITETIIVTEEVIVGNEVNVLRSIGNVALGSVLDTTFETITDKALDFVDSKAPTNYSSYAHNVRQNNPSMSRKDVLVSMQRSIRINRILSETVSYLMDLGRSLLPW